MTASYDFDALVIGSGFGGSVAALRLAEQGFRVAVLEQGRRVSNADMQAASRSLRRLFWLPAIGATGFFTQAFFRHMMIVGGVGVGGGSLVYAAVLLKPEQPFFHDPAWSGLGVDWEQELSPCYETAARMLGRQPYTHMHAMDEYLQQTAKAMGAGASFAPAPLGIYLGEPEVEVLDPYFQGQGPPRKGCQRCGECLTGCPHEAKNTLDKNYLYLAEQLGAQVLPEHQARLVRPLTEGGYEVESANPLQHNRPYPTLRARKVILAAGVLGTLELLFRSRKAGALAELSPRLGEMVRTNSEAIAGILSPDPQADFSEGPAITSHFYTGNTHITQNRFPAGYWFMKLYTGPLVDGDRPLRRSLKTIFAYLSRPREATASIRARRWTKRVSALTVMQNSDNQLAFRYGRSPFSLFRKSLQSVSPSGKRAPTYLEEANRAAKHFARLSGGIPQNNLLESLLNQSVTAHILGGCPMGRNRESGVIDTRHEVFGYPGLFVVDGAAVPANVGVNPSLTITAMAERAMGYLTRG